jgi:hypothetical protein
VIRSDLVVAVGDEEQRGQAPDPTTDELEQIQRRIVRPVGVLDHHCARHRWESELGKERREKIFPTGSFPQRGSERTIRLLRNVVKGTKWPRRGERVAQTPERERIPGTGRGEMLDKAGLAYARLASDRRDSASAGSGVTKEPVQLGENWFALEKVHVEFGDAERCLDADQAHRILKALHGLVRGLPMCGLIIPLPETDRS